MLTRWSWIQAGYFVTGLSSTYLQARHHRGYEDRHPSGPWLRIGIQQPGPQQPPTNPGRSYKDNKFETNVLYANNLKKEMLPVWGRPCCSVRMLRCFWLVCWREAFIYPTIGVLSGPHSVPFLHHGSPGWATDFSQKIKTLFLVWDLMMIWWYDY